MPEALLVMTLFLSHGTVEQRIPYTSMKQCSREAVRVASRKNFIEHPRKFRAGFIRASATCIPQ